MAYTALSIVAPTLSEYDPDNPTQATEELNLALHNILQDMEDATGTWYLTDGVPTAADAAFFFGYVHDVIEDVFDYAKGAIETYRSTGTPTLAKPTKTTISNFSVIWYPLWSAEAFKVYAEGLKMCYLIYYMWKTETDPLRVKDYIRDMLLAWPLQDIAIDLNDETGTSLKIYPQWKNLET